MKYYYDIDLYFYDYYISCYKWKYTTNYIRLPIYKISNINIILNNNIGINTDYKYILVSDEINTIALEIINNKVAFISSLKPNDELSINKLVYDIDYNLDYKILSKKDNKEIILFKDKIKNEINKASNDKIKYLYFSNYNKLNTSISLMKRKLIDDLEYNYDKIYDNILLGD